MTACILVDGLTVIPADVDADAADLKKLAGWARRYSPLVGLDPPDGLWIIATGTAHLHGGETAMLNRLVRNLARLGIAATAAIAPAAGAAHALAHYAPGPVRVCNDLADVLPLPIEALRIAEPRMLKRLRYLGLDTIGKVAALPRAPVRHRFGAHFCLRLEQALGLSSEVLQPLPPPPGYSGTRRWQDGVGNTDQMRAPAAALIRDLCAKLTQAGAAVIRVHVHIHGELRDVPLHVELRTPSRDAGHLISVLDLKLAAMTLEEGATGMSLTVHPEDWLDGVDDQAGDALQLRCDRLSARLGEGNVFSIRLLQSDLYELATARVPAPQAEVPAKLRAYGPARLFDPGEPVTLTEPEDGSPAMLRWRGRNHRVTMEIGFEQAFNDWWNAPAKMPVWMRDYHEIEIATGERLWLARNLPAEPDPGGQIDTAWRCIGVTAL